MNDDFDIQQQLQTELDSGERIVWQAKAEPRFFAPKALFPAIFGVIWLGFISTMITFGSHGRTQRSGGLFPFFPFAFIGLIVLATPLFRFLGSRRTWYLITNRRVLIITLGSNRKVLSYYPDKLQGLERRERADGRGDIVIDRTSTGSFNSGYRGSAYLQEVGFMNIPDVKNVEGLVRDLARQPRDTR
jgi:hypothetical protein